MSGCRTSDSVQFLFNVNHISPFSAVMSAFPTTLLCPSKGAQPSERGAVVLLKPAKLENSNCQEVEIPGASVEHVKELKLILACHEMLQRSVSSFSSFAGPCLGLAHIYQELI